MKTKLRSLRKASWRAWRTDRKNVLALVTLVDTSHSTKISGLLGLLGLYLSATGTPPVWSEARMVRRKSTWAWRLWPLSSWPWVASLLFSCATTRWTAARSWIGPLGSARSSSFSGRLGGRLAVRSIRFLSSSRLRCCSNFRSWSRGRPSWRGSSSGRSGWGSVLSPRALLIRCTSTPRTPEPSPRPNAAIASRARSRRAASDPSLSAAAICWRSVSRLMSPGGSPPAWASVIRSRAAWASVARKKNRSNTRSNTRRSSFDLARVAASASLKSLWSVQVTRLSASNASRISEVPIATPSWRRSSAKDRSWPSRLPGGWSGIPP